VLFADGKEVNVQAEGVKDERELKAFGCLRLLGRHHTIVKRNFKADMTEALNIFDYYGINAVIYHVRTHNKRLLPLQFKSLCSWWSGS